jgi:hypothetical protein
MDIERKEQEFRVCSLTKTFRNNLLWKNYASEFRGFAIEVELPDNSENIRDVEYRPYPYESAKSVPIIIVPNQKTLCNSDKATPDILFSKGDKWRGEEEIRILHKDKWYDLTQNKSVSTPIKRIIVCSERMNESVFKVMKIICEKKDIPLHDLKFGLSELYTELITCQELKG